MKCEVMEVGEWRRNREGERERLESGGGIERVRGRGWRVEEE